MELLPGAVEVGHLELAGEQVRGVRGPEAPVVIVGNDVSIIGCRLAQLDRFHVSMLPRLDRATGYRLESRP